MREWLSSAEREIVNLFWKRCGEIEPFPRALERSVALALPLALIKLPRLQLSRIEGWLQQRGITYQFNCHTRAVRGCLIAFGGAGTLFVDGSDPDDERRFTLAHEVSHFLVDYWRPRRQAIAIHGERIIEVLDGTRPPTINERINALLVQTPIGTHTSLMERDPNTMDPHIWQVEDRADRIALALLAPPEQVIATVNLDLDPYEKRLSSITSVLRTIFGLPWAPARSYGQALLRLTDRGPSWLETLGLK